MTNVSLTHHELYMIQSSLRDYNPLTESGEMILDKLKAKIDNEIDKIEGR
jgi:hypothetical protein